MNIEKCPICNGLPNAYITEAGKMGSVSIYYGVMKCENCKIVVDGKDVNENTLRNRIVTNWNLFCVTGKRGEQ